MRRSLFTGILALVLVAFITGCAQPVSDTTAPTVSATVPTNAATSVARNGDLSVTFSEAMDTATISASTFTLAGPGTTAVTGVVSLSEDGLTATFNPASDLAGSTLFTATVTTGAHDLAGNALASNYAWTFTTGAAPDTTPPTVSSTVPASSATGVALNSNITATFSEAMTSGTISGTTFTLTGPGTTAVAGAVSYTGTTATFNPTADLAGNTLFTATITTGAHDLAGNALASNHVWTFTTGATPDTTPPTVSSTVPAASATGVVVSSNITATFSEAMNSDTLTGTTFTLAGPGTTAVAGAVSYTGTTATFNPTANLAGSTLYTATITTGVHDVAGNALASNHVWTFTTADVTAPVVSSTVPAASATGVAVNSYITATFSEAMNAGTISGTTFTLTGPGTTAVAGAVTYAGTTATFNPSANLVGGTVYTATITTGAQDLAGNALASNHVWTFTTVAALPLGPSAVALGSAGNYVILAKTAISTTIGTAITGDLGISPAAQTFVTGFSLVEHSTNTYATSSLVTGKVYASTDTAPTPANLTTAVSSMETAYTDAAGRVTPDFINLGSGDITGRTLVPGLYNWGTSLQATSGFTISGGANDVWIFQVAGDLTIGNGVMVTLGGSAQAKNIFWQVAGQTTLGTTANFKGIVLCMTQIVVETGAAVNGRLLAQTQVTLDANAVTAPSL